MNIFRKLVVLAVTIALSACGASITSTTEISTLRQLHLNHPLPFHQNLSLIFHPPMARSFILQIGMISGK